MEIKQSFKELKHTNEFDEADEKKGEVEVEEEKEEEVVEEEFAAEEIVLEENEVSLPNDLSAGLEESLVEEEETLDPDVDDAATARKRWFEADKKQDAERKLTGKQKRKVERRQRLKKTGVTFYDSVDVKNRSGRLIDPHAPPKQGKKAKPGKKHQKRV